MKDILSGAELIEVAIGINQGETPLEQSKYFCSLLFKQVNGDKMETVRDIYAISKEQFLQSFPPIANIGKRIKRCTKTFLGENFVIRYEFEDGSYMNTWS